jgi:hypothetical protein
MLMNLTKLAAIAHFSKPTMGLEIRIFVKPTVVNKWKALY